MHHLAKDGRYPTFSKSEMTLELEEYGTERGHRRQCTKCRPGGRLALNLCVLHTTREPGQDIQSYYLIRGSFSGCQERNMFPGP